MVPDTDFFKAVFSSSGDRAPAFIRGAAFNQTTMRARPGWVQGAEALRAVPGRGLSMARGGPEFDCGQPWRHPFIREGGLGPAEAGPPSYWRVRTRGGCLLARSDGKVPATRRPIQSDGVGRARAGAGGSIHKKPRVHGPTFKASWIGLDERLPSSALRAHSRPGERQMEVAPVSPRSARACRGRRSAANEPSLNRPRSGC